MNVWESIILGIIQGLTEFLPVSSSGHIVLGEAILNVHSEESLAFTVLVHFATVLSTVIIFRQFIFDTFKGIFAPRWNEAKDFAIWVIVSMLPVLVVGLFFKTEVEALFSGKIGLVGIALLVTGTLLLLTLWSGQKAGRVTPLRAFIIGLAQAIAVIPGISRSGATIATGLLLGVDRQLMARFSFLMVIPPIFGAMLIDTKDMISVAASGTMNVAFLPLLAGFMAAFITGLVACRLMIRIVQLGKLQYFAYYCFAIGLLAIGYSWWL